MKMKSIWMALSLLMPLTSSAQNIDTVELAKSALYRNWTNSEQYYKKVIPSGTKVTIQVKCECARESPFVKFVYPEGAKLESRDMESYSFGAHLIGDGSLNYMEKGRTYEIEAIIVNRGSVCYGAYFMYVEGYKLVEVVQPKKITEP